MFTDLKHDLTKDYKYVVVGENGILSIGNMEVHQIIDDKDIHKWQFAR